MSRITSTAAIVLLVLLASFEMISRVAGNMIVAFDVRISQSDNLSLGAYQLQIAVGERPVWYNSATLIASMRYYRVCPTRLTFVEGEYQTPRTNDFGYSFVVAGNSAEELSVGWFAVCHFGRNTMNDPLYEQLMMYGDEESLHGLLRSAETDGAWLYALISGYDYSAYVEMVSRLGIARRYGRAQYGSYNVTRRLYLIGLTSAPFGVG